MAETSEINQPTDAELEQFEQAPEEIPVVEDNTVGEAEEEDNAVSE